MSERPERHSRERPPRGNGESADRRAKDGRPGRTPHGRSAELPSTGGHDADDDAAPRVLLAANPSPLTLDGTRTHLIGRRRVAIIDPGPARADHIDAIIEAVGDAEAATILLTHDHPDHAAAATPLAARLADARIADVPVLGARRGTLADGDRVETDAGELIAVATPGHTPDHIAFHWSAHDAVFCGDLMMGGMDTTLVAPPEGDLGRYLASLERVRALRPRVIHPAHGPAFGEPDAAIDAYVRHRESRERRVLEALRQTGPTGADELVDAVYGTELDPALRDAARAAVVAYLEHLAAGGEVRRAGRERWAVA